MINYPDINPVAFSVFGWAVHWYGLAYLSAFVAAFFGGQRLLQKPAFSDLRNLTMDDMIWRCALGVVIGGRAGYVLFYNPGEYFADPLQIVRLWDGGMSFHGGLAGVIIALFLYAREGGMSFFRLTDFAAVLTPVGLCFGRIGNFINGELPGRLTSSDLPWAMIFPGDSAARHPSSLYQAFLEGAVLFAVVYFFAMRRRTPGFVSGVFLCAYALLRMFSELFREPDAHLGFIVGGFSMGQLLSLPMLFGGIALLTAEKWIPVFSEFSGFSGFSGFFKFFGKSNTPPVLPNSESPKNDITESPTQKTEAAEDDNAAASAPWQRWKNIFAAAPRAIKSEEDLSRRRSRREMRRTKKKRRR